MTEWLLLAVSLLLIAICGVFVAAEFALLAVDRSTVERAAGTGDRGAAGVLHALRTLSTQLSGVQLAITLTNLAIGFLAEPALSRLLRGPLRAVGVTGDALTGTALVVGLVVSSVLTMVFGELLPKNLAIAAPLAVARAVQRPVRAFTRLMSVPIRALNGLADGVLSMFGIAAQEELASARSPGELASLVRHSAREGTLPAHTAALLTRSLAFGDKRAGDVMTPRPNVIAVPATASVTDFLALVHEHGRSRMPVVGAGGVDDVVGVVELDHAVAVPAERRGGTTVRSVLVPAVEVPETLPLDDVLSALRRGRSQLAVVVDEYGGTAGLLTGEDLLEELAGEVEDEYETSNPAVCRLDDGWDVSGLLRPDQIAAATGYRLPERGPYDTLGGLLMHVLGRIPQAGDQARIADITATVARMDGHRVDRVRLSRAAGHESETGR